MQENAGVPVIVSSVDCVATTTNQFDCIARVTGTDGYGGLETVTLPIDASCDDTTCLWRTTN